MAGRGATVVAYAPRHASAFRDLNIAWLEQLFTVDPKDLLTLDDPQGAVLDRGGAILIAENAAGVAVGCLALVPYAEGVLELAKMAVADAARGRGVGRLLMDAALAQARAMGARTVYLESNSGLAPALALYERSGFRHLEPHERPGSRYARADIYMRRELA